MRLSHVTIISLAIASTALISAPSFAQTPTQQNSPTVYRWDGKPVGADPDSRIRFQLVRDGYADEN